MEGSKKGKLFSVQASSGVFVWKAYPQIEQVWLPWGTQLMYLYERADSLGTYLCCEGTVEISPVYIAHLREVAG